ncbi:hypothetical protein [Hymenobacter rubidus]|uniref:hypothetical protein n=1 Tax=Hymenobacter rubidus TaxID=1441626 RepID=UPI00191DADB4|nr:hypothetical protein [Hymenobacter rubidus]
MTDREPDDLYDALRDRLANYGQEPPAPLWADIRAQLPPPVAVPQLRQRKRRRAVWLAVLLLIVSVFWQWRLSEWLQKVSRSETTARSTSIQHTQTHKALRTNPATQLPAADGTAVTAEGTSTGIASNNGGAGLAAGTRPADQLMGAGSNTAATAGTPAPVRSATGAGRAATVAAGRLAMASVSPSGSRSAAKTAAGISARRLGKFRASRNGRTGAVSQTEAATGSSAVAVATTLATQATFATAGSRRRVRYAKATTRPAAGQLPRPHLNPQRLATAKNALPGPAAFASAAGPASAPVSELPTDAGSFAAWSRLQPLLVALTQTAGATPTGQAQLIGHQHPAVAQVSRWAVQVLGGPALTYRYLGTASGLSYSTTPNITAAAPTGSTSTAATSSVAELERPALGYGAQVSVRRVLNGRWAASAGLGYAEYATRLALQRVSSTTGLPSNTILHALDSANRLSAANTTIHRRDTYRFLTVPLRLSYTWAAGPRWQVNGLLGMDVAAYLGGNSTEGTACACQTQSWGVSGSPYRRVSLGASLGIEARYHLTDKWTLLAQPTGTYLLTPLAKSTTSLYQRYLFGGTALLGVSHDLP